MAKLGLSLLGTGAFMTYFSGITTSYATMGWSSLLSTAGTIMLILELTGGGFSANSNMSRESRKAQKNFFDGLENFNKSEKEIFEKLSKNHDSPVKQKDIKEINSKFVELEKKEKSLILDMETRKKIVEKDNFNFKDYYEESKHFISQATQVAIGWRSYPSFEKFKERVDEIIKDCKSLEKEIKKEEHEEHNDQRQDYRIFRDLDKLKKEIIEMKNLADKLVKLISEKIGNNEVPKNSVNLVNRMRARAQQISHRADHMEEYVVQGEKISANIRVLHEKFKSKMDVKARIIKRLSRQLSLIVAFSKDGIDKRNMTAEQVLSKIEKELIPKYLNKIKEYEKQTSEEIKIYEGIKNDLKEFEEYEVNLLSHLKDSDSLVENLSRELTYLEQSMKFMDDKFKQAYSQISDQVKQLVNGLKEDLSIDVTKDSKLPERLAMRRTYIQNLLNYLEGLNTLESEADLKLCNDLKQSLKHLDELLSKRLEMCYDKNSLFNAAKSMLNVAFKGYT
jgi:hypothetical protein